MNTEIKLKHVRERNINYKNYAKLVNVLNEIENLISKAEDDNLTHIKLYKCDYNKELFNQLVILLNSEYGYAISKYISSKYVIISWELS